MANAVDKLRRKHLDMIVLNSLRDAESGFGTDTNKVTVITASGSVAELPLMTKTRVAEEILKTIAEL